MGFDIHSYTCNMRKTILTIRNFSQTTWLSNPDLLDLHLCLSHYQQIVRVLFLYPFIQLTLIKIIKTCFQPINTLKIYFLIS